MIGTREAAHLLGICCQRVRQLLKQGRIKNAQKIGRYWQIPLFNGMPKVVPARFGPKGTWRKRVRKAPTRIHVNQHIIKKNKKLNTTQPVIKIQGGKDTGYCHYVEIMGKSRVVYQPDKALSCGARVWIEVDPEVRIIPKVFQMS